MLRKHVVPDRSRYTPTDTFNYLSTHPHSRLCGPAGEKYDPVALFSYNSDHPTVLGCESVLTNAMSSGVDVLPPECVRL